MHGSEPLHGNDRRGYLSDEFLDRVRRAYRVALKAGSGPTGGMWNQIASRQVKIHAALIADGNAALRDLFCNPIVTDFFYGADGFNAGEEEANGLLKALRQFTDEEFDFPNPFPGETGARTPRGIASYRAIQSAYQAWRAWSLLGSQPNASYVEIGPGVGRVAYYLFRRGVDCTTIDLPIGAAAQACFLGATLGPDNLWLSGDTPSLMDGRVKLFFAGADLASRRYDLAFNADSLTEMRWRTALHYGCWINRHANTFLSINHERNYIHVEEVASAAFHIAKVVRCQYPLRSGYFEEVFYLRGGSSPRRGMGIFRYSSLGAKAWIRRIGANFA